LDDKTLFRTCEGILSKSVKDLLEKLSVENSGTIMALGLEQEFFAIPREAYLKRIDIRSTGRALVG
jgi:glutamine synthetase